MALSSLEAYDLVRFADQLQTRLAAAQGELAPRRALKAEKDWLSAASALLAAAREPAAGLLDRVRALPELALVRDEYALEFQGQWVDTLERLHAGITFHAGNRDPVIEALYPHTRFAALRRADKDAVGEYEKELDRRLRSAYVSRLLAQPAYAFAAPVLAAVTEAFARWQSAFEGEESPEAQAVELRKELLAAAKKLDVAVKQARLLAEAALAPVAGMFEEQGLAAKPKKRGKPAKEKGPAPEEAAAPAETSPAPVEKSEAVPAEKAEAAPVEEENKEPDAQAEKKDKKRGRRPRNGMQAGTDPT